MSGIFDQIINYSPPLIVSGTVNYDGTWDASTNTPTLNNPPAGSTKGDYYVVSVAGTQFSLTFAVGDWIISNGTAWEKVDLTDAVSSVFGRTGAVVGVSTDYSSVGLTNTAIGASSPSTGAFTTLGSNNTTTLNGTTIPASSTLLVSGGALGTPSGGTITNLTGTASININGTVGATTAAAGSFTTVAATASGTPAAFTKNSDGIIQTLTRASVSEWRFNIANSDPFGGQAGSLAIYPGNASVDFIIGRSNGTTANLKITDANGNAAFAGTGTFTGGINSTAIGATTASTGAFTTLSSTGGASFTSASSAITYSEGLSGFGSFYAKSSGTNDAYLFLGNTVERGRITANNSNQVIIGVSSSATQIGLFSSTGLAVTGALSATGASGQIGLFESTINNNGQSYVYNRTASVISIWGVLHNAGTRYSYIGTESNDGFRIITNNADRVTIDSSGNVGIGTTSPAQKLDVFGTGMKVNNASYVGYLGAGDAFVGGSASDFAVRSDNVLSFGSGGPYERARIDSSGNLLVGTTTTTANGGDVQISKGITFPATQVACSNANTLDDYEEGTWTPSVGGTSTYLIQEGTYTKIGRCVTIRGSMQINVLGTGSTSAISGHPFANSAITPISIGFFSNLAVNVVYIGGYLGTSTMVFTSLTTASGTANNAIALFGNSARVDFACTYFV